MVLSLTVKFAMPILNRNLAAVSSVLNSRISRLAPPMFKRLSEMRVVFHFLTSKQEVNNWMERSTNFRRKQFNTVAPSVQISPVSLNNLIVSENKA